MSVLKKIMAILLLFIGLGAIFLYLNDTSYSPLQEKDFQKLFPKYNGNKEKICNIDFLGMNFKSESFEVYLYMLDAVPVDLNYPVYNGAWEQKEIIDETVISKWKN